VRLPPVTTTELAPADQNDERAPERAHLPAAGTVLAGKYRVERVLGRGGMGVVVQGRQLELDRPVAIKFLRAPLTEDARPLQRFGREARMIARMQSEHVVRVFDVGRDHGVPFIVMERLHGHDLAREIGRGVLPAARAVELVLHACEALGEAHSLGIVHRDVKPSNLFVAESFGGRESLKVLDFGVSKWLTGATEIDTPVVTTGGGAVGTPAFASPEQLTRPETVDLRTDVWALGVVLYQALSGELPFRAPTVPALYSQIIGAEPTPLPAGPDVPAELVSVVMRCLRRKPEERYPSMLELARALMPFAPARAHAIVDSLAGLDVAKIAANVEEEAEPVLSPLTSTLEISQITGDATGGAASTAPSVRRALTAVGVLGGAAVVATIVAWAVHSSSRQAAPSAKPAVSSEPSAANHEDTSSRAAPTAEHPAPSASVAVSATEAPHAPPQRTVHARPRTTTPVSSSAVVSPPVTTSAPVAAPSSKPAAARSDVVPLYRH